MTPDVSTVIMPSSNIASQPILQASIATGPCLASSSEQNCRGLMWAATKSCSGKTPEHIQHWASARPWRRCLRSRCCSCRAKMDAFLSRTPENPNLAGAVSRSSVTRSHFSKTCLITSTDGANKYPIFALPSDLNGDAVAWPLPVRRVSSIFSIARGTSN